MATPDYKTTRPWLRQTKDESRKTKGRAKPELWNYGLMELWIYGTTELWIYGTTELWNYGITDRAKWLKAHGS